MLELLNKLMKLSFGNFIFDCWRIKRHEYLLERYFSHSSHLSIHISNVGIINLLLFHIFGWNQSTSRCNRNYYICAFFLNIKNSLNISLIWKFVDINDHFISILKHLNKCNSYTHIWVGIFNSGNSMILLVNSNMYSLFLLKCKLIINITLYFFDAVVVFILLHLELAFLANFIEIIQNHTDINAIEVMTEVFEADPEAFVVFCVRLDHGHCFVCP